MGKNKFNLNRKPWLPEGMIESEAMRSLKGAKTIIVLLRFYQKRRWIRRRKKVEYIDEPLSFTYGEAQALGIGKSRFHEIIRVLCRYGFIEIEYQGGGLARDYSRYVLSERWRDYGTKNFKHIEKPKAGRPGCDVQSWMRRKAQYVEADGRNDQASEDAGEKK